MNSSIWFDETEPGNGVLHLSRGHRFEFLNSEIRHISAPENILQISENSANPDG